MHMKIILAFCFVICGFAPVFAQSPEYPRLDEDERSYGTVEITDFSMGAIPVYNKEDGPAVDYIVFELKDYENGRFFATRAQNGLKFYPYQIWQGEDAAREAFDCEVTEDRRYVLQLEVVGDVSGGKLKVVTHFAMGCPQNIDGVPMYIPYGIGPGDGKVPGALDFGEYFLIDYNPDFMRLKSWEELMHAATGVSNYGGLEVYDKPGGALIYQDSFGQDMTIVSELHGDWVEAEGYDGRRGWIKWRENGALHPQIHDIWPKRSDEFENCLNDAW